MPSLWHFMNISGFYCSRKQNSHRYIWMVRPSFVFSLALFVKHFYKSPLKRQLLKIPLCSYSLWYSHFMTLNCSVSNRNVMIFWLWTPFSITHQYNKSHKSHFVWIFRTTKFVRKIYSSRLELQYIHSNEYLLPSAYIYIYKIYRYITGYINIVDKRLEKSHPQFHCVCSSRS